MKRFKCAVSVESEYEIEINDEELGTEFIEAFKKHFYDFDDWSEHAAHIAARRALGDEFIEGYGVPLVDGKNPTFSNDETSLERAINIKVNFENDADVDTDELSDVREE